MCDGHERHDRGGDEEDRVPDLKHIEPAVGGRAPVDVVPHNGVGHKVGQRYAENAEHHGY